MKPSRKARLPSNGVSKRSKPAPMSPPKPRPQSESSSPVLKPQVQSTTVTTTPRYQKNLKSLRRIDPTIVSIIDQFSHICLYRLHEGKWQKDGFEGASFLFERAAYPPYGLFILNRAGMHDYIHPIHPEDEIQAEGEYLMYRSYPEFTAKRLAMVKSAPGMQTDSWTDAHHRVPSASDPLTNWRYLLNQKPDKGPHETVMFWFLGSDSEQHEPLSDTIGRLMSFIRKGEPYPYSLDCPPPPAPHPTNIMPQDQSATSPVGGSPAKLQDQQQSNGTRPPTAPINGTTSDLDKLFSKLIPAPAASPALDPDGNKVTLETLFASASTPASSTPISYPPSTTTNKGIALLDTIFASATPPPGATSPPLSHSHHVSSEPFPSPPSAPPSTRPTFSTAHLRGDISSSEPESSELESPTCHAPAQLIHSPQPTNSQLPQILTQEVISALLGMTPSRTSSVASSHRRYEGDVESSDDLHDADSPIDTRPQTHANRTKKHELGDVTPRPPLRGFASSEKVLPNVPHPLPSHHSAPCVLPTAASSVPSAATPSEPGPIVVAEVAAPVVPAPRIGTSPAPRALVPFHEESSLWPYPRAPLDDRDDIVELDFADTSALSDVDAFERRRQTGKNGSKFSKKDRAREREEIERSWDVPGDVSRNVNAGPPHSGLGKPSQARVHTASRPAAAPSPQPCALKANQPSAAAAPVESTQTSTRGPATAPPSDNKSKAKSKPITNGPKATKVPIPDTTPATNGAALARSAVSSAIIEAVQTHSNINANANATANASTDRNEFVRELLTLIHTDPSFVDRLWTEYRARG